MAIVKDVCVLIVDLILKLLFFGHLGAVEIWYILNIDCK